MNKFLEKVIKKGMDKVGDSMYEKVCPFILYQPKACPRKQVIVENQKSKDDKTGEVEN